MRNPYVANCNFKVETRSQKGVPRREFTSVGGSCKRERVSPLDSIFVFLSPFSIRSLSNPVCVSLASSLLQTGSLGDTASRKRPAGAFPLANLSEYASVRSRRRRTVDTHFGTRTGILRSCSRVIMLFKIMKRNVGEVMHPQKVKTVRLSGKPVPEKILANTNAYFAAYILLMVASFFLVSFDSFLLGSPFGFTENSTAVLSCFNNIGPGLGKIGPSSNFSQFGILSKCVLIMDMLAGRLEIFPIIVLFSRKSWQRG